MKHGLVVFTLAVLPLLAQAQTIWRCGPEGRSFSDTPCPGGQALALADTRPSQDLAEARRLAERELRLADKLRRERLREESAQRGNGMAALGPVSGSVGVKAQRRSPQQPQRAKPAARRSAPSAGETFRAVAPASRRAQG